MTLEDLLVKLTEIARVHPYASVKVGIPDVAPDGDQLVEISDVHYEAEGKRVVIEL